MALHDYKCVTCGFKSRDYYVPVSEIASDRAPTCPTCYTKMQWIPQVGSMDAKEPFQQSTVYVRQPDGTEKPTTIGSLSQMRAIERESEQRARDGEGQQMVWRDYSQDRNHSDTHAFAKDPSERPVKNPRVTIRKVDEARAESVGYGPGVSDSNTSALVD